MNVSSLDLNLLKAFHALFQERHVGRAGARVGLAQPSMSNALNRLRARFDDPLFTRSPDGMTPTSRAEEIAPYVDKALELVAEMLDPPRFDPLQAEERVTLATSDIIAHRLAPRLLAFAAEHAPKLRFHFTSVDKGETAARLDDGSVTLAIGVFGALPARYHRKKLMQDGFVCIARADHPTFGDVLTLDDFVSAGHVLTTLRGDDDGVVDRALKRLGRSRRVAMTCAAFTLTPAVVARTDLIATVPRSLKPIAEREGCKTLAPPLELPVWDNEMVWTQKSQNSPLVRFIVNAVEKAMEP